MGLFKELFCWWSGNTLGMRWTLWRSKAEKVGTDEFGNSYYRAPETIKGYGEKRYVVYRDLAEPSTIPPGWHLWMHHVVDTPPSASDPRPREWQKPHRANMTGTPDAYRPAGSTLTDAQRPKATGDYQAWTPR